LSGAGSAAVWVDDELDATISGAGSINYYGSPEVTKQISGVGASANLATSSTTYRSDNGRLLR